MESIGQERNEFEVFDAIEADGSASAPEIYVQDEGMYRFVAYMSPYLFWITVIGLLVGVSAF